MVSSKIKKGDIIVCVKPYYDITLHKQYRLLKMTKALTCNYYTILDDTGVINSNLYTSDHFISLTEFNNTRNLK